MNSSTGVPPWLQQRTDGVVLTVVISPNARSTGIVGPYGDALKIRIAAPPSDGKANSMLLRFITDTLGVRSPDVRILFGQSARRKGILVVGMRAEEIEEVVRQAC